MDCSDRHLAVLLRQVFISVATIFPFFVEDMNDAAMLGYDRLLGW
jgi:hypothetical protein